MTRTFLQQEFFFLCCRGHLAQDIYLINNMVHVAMQIFRVIYLTNNAKTMVLFTFAIE